MFSHCFASASRDGLRGKGGFPVSQPFVLHGFKDSLSPAAVLSIFSGTDFL